MVDTRIFDTDILIWVQRAHPKAAKLINQTQRRIISVITLMELLQCAKTKLQHKQIREFLTACNFEVLPLFGNIGHRALVYIEEYTLSAGIRVGDALIAATAVENGLVLATGNYKHFKCIQDLQLDIFQP